MTSEDEDLFAVMTLEDLFTAEELALIDRGEYRPGRAVLDAKLDLWSALERYLDGSSCNLDDIEQFVELYESKVRADEREACAHIVEDWDSDLACPQEVADAIRARGEK